MVPKDRIELSADPYQGSVLPLNYIGKYLISISYLKNNLNTLNKINLDNISNLYILCYNN